MNYREAEHFLYSLNNLPYNAKHDKQKHRRASLTRMRNFLALIGNPEQRIPHYIHVTGTSGKGSVSMMLHSTLKAHKQKTGLIISPHHTTLRERWQINNRPMSQSSFARIMTELKPKLDTYIRMYPRETLTPLEFANAIGLYFFAQEKVSWAVIEVNCGGRFDPTNVIPHKDIAIITHIGKDHIDTIGPTLRDIAYEKAGIITPRTHVITAETRKEIASIIAHEAVRNKALCSIVTLNHDQLSLTEKTIVYQGHTYPRHTLGMHQVKNTALVIEAARALGIQEETIAHGLATTNLPLRCEIVSTKPLIVLDGAHNADKLRATVAMLLSTFPKKRFHILLGFTAQKNIAELTRILSPLEPISIACTRFMNPGIFRKAANPGLIAATCKRLFPHTRTEAFLDPQDALVWSKKQQKTGDVITITGSLFLSGELRPLILK